MKITEKDTKIIGGGKSIIYADAKYYLVSETPSKVCVSSDLESWDEFSLNDDYLKATNIAYGNGTFVVCGGKGNTADTYIYYSLDGIKWNPVKLPTTVDFCISCNSVKFINNRFVIAASGWHTTFKTDGVVTRVEEKIVFFESVNGINWTLRTFTINRGTNVNYKSATAMDIDYNNGTYVYIGNNGNIYTSSNLQNWIKRTSGVSLKLVGISYGKGQFVVTGDEGIILTSINGINWEKQISNTTAYLIRSRYANGMYIACGYNGVILQSLDGITWKNISIKTGGVHYGLAYNNIEDIMVITAHHYTHGTIPLFLLDVSRELSAGNDENIMQFINTDIIVMRNNYTEAGIIETIEFSDNGTNEEVTISGRFLSSLLSRRIIKSKINFKGNTIEGMNTIVSTITPLTSLWEIVSVSMNSPDINFQVTYKNVYDYLCKLSQYSNIAFRIVPNVDSKVYMFEVWKGLDRTSEQNENEAYSFSDDNFNIEQGRLTISDKTKVNYVLVGGSGEDNNRTLVIVDEGKKEFDLYEVFSDQKGISETDLSANEYKEKLKQAGEESLSNGTFQLEVTALIQQDYKTKWDLGDVVNIMKKKWGVYTTYRIIEVEEIIEDGKKTIYPTFGSPLPSVWEED